MNVRETKLPGVCIVEPVRYSDARGEFFESFSAARYEQHGLPSHFVQDNFSRSSHGVLRGLHYQVPNSQGKLITVLEGEIADVAVDIRTGSPSFGEWIMVTLSAANGWQLFIPPGFAHGFQATAESALVHYKCTDYYDPRGESSVLWSDEDLMIGWPLPPILSAKDTKGTRLKEVPAALLPVYQGS